MALFSIDVIIKEIFPLCFEMAESFENLDNILRGWAKEKVQKSLAEALNRFERQEQQQQHTSFTHLKIKKYIKEMILISLRGYQLPAITKKLKTSRSWFK